MVILGWVMGGIEWFVGGFGKGFGGSRFCGGFDS